MPSDPSSTHAAPPLRPAVMNLVRPNDPVPARITRNEICTASRKAAGFVRHIEFDVGGTPLAGACIAGQSVGVVPDGLDHAGKQHKVRLYSLACASTGEDGDGAVLSTTVKRSIDEHWDDHSLFLGVASNYLCDRKEGDTIRVCGPNGKRFVLPDAPAEHGYLFFATGTGVAPFRGMLRDLIAAGVTRPITLVMGAPYASDLLYHDEFLNAANEVPNFTYLTAISREKQEDVPERLYVQDRLRTDRERLAGQLRDDGTLIYVCGIAGMEVGIFRQLATELTGSALEQYIEADRATLADTANWNRKMINREIKHTKRVFLEVYA